MLVITSFGPIPFDAIKTYIDPKVVEAVEEGMKPFLESIEDNVPEDIDYYINNLAQRNGWTFPAMSSFLRDLAKVNFSAFFSVILKEIAIELDKKYNNHIENSEEIYCISLTNGYICKSDKDHIKNYKNFAAFRTLDDAKTAHKITRTLLKEMFKSDK